jgi:oxygen-independent coproporphyrinogen III oxidase
MAGIYIHIPFCKQACNYCNFHFSTSLSKKNDFLAALQTELTLQKNYLQHTPIETIYFGGGTPSLLSISEIEHIFETIFKNYDIANNAEITLEANPDDLSTDKLRALATTPINRLSIGIQSFFDDDLAFMRRAHNAAEAEKSIKVAQDIGFQNLTIDLIYGTPTMNNERWRQNIQKALAFDTPHISSYCLTVEPKTLLEKQIKKGELRNVNDENAALQFEILIDDLTDNGYEHYEISNFSKPNCHARHNSNYWLGVPYLGAGPSAHSFDGFTRQHNIANNSLYISHLQQNKLCYEVENLTLAQRYNEYILTTLRTKWGAEEQKIKVFGATFWQYFALHVQSFLNDETVVLQNGIYTLSKKGKMIADYIAVALFFEED